jgi:hypothetical protein
VTLYCATLQVAHFAIDLNVEPLWRYTLQEKGAPVTPNMALYPAMNGNTELLRGEKLMCTLTRACTEILTYRAHLKTTNNNLTSVLIEDLKVPITGRIAMSRDGIGDTRA